MLIFHRSPAILRLPPVISHAPRTIFCAPPDFFDDLSHFFGFPRISEVSPAGKYAEKLRGKVKNIRGKARFCGWSLKNAGGAAI
jgi:hypothetical protein